MGEGKTSTGKAARSKVAAEGCRPRKRDRRALYTEGAIKDALLAEVAQRPFGEISISAVCRGAEISRPTFYLHYGNLAEVLDELIGDVAEYVGDGALEICDSCSQSGVAQAPGAAIPRTKESLPFCELVLGEGKYAPLFKDSYVSGRVVERIVDNAANAVARAGADSEDIHKLRVLNLFRMNGCMAAAKALSHRGHDWAETRPIVDAFVASGFDAVLGDASEN